MATPSVAAASSVVPTPPEVIDFVPIPTPSQPPAAAEISFAELAWKELEKPASWVTLSDWETYKVKHGLSSFDELSFLGDAEIEELDSKLTTIPLKKFKKYMENIK
jgi:hypothetical protein